jgi:adenosylmethionine-8-amino-7-oxononanoate aminotransferase
MDCESIGDSALGLREHTPSIRTGSMHDLSHMPTQMGNHVAAAESEIQISLMKGRVEHLEQTREKLTKALETMITKVKCTDRR